MQPVKPEPRVYSRKGARPSGRDPAPSRWSYRMHRMWLTPAYRRMLRVGLPGLLVAGLALWFLSDKARVEDITTWVDETKRAVEERPEFMIKVLSIEGASPELADAVREQLALRLPLSSFDIELEPMRQNVESFNAVASARMRIKPGGVLVVEIVERQPAVLWRHVGGLSLLDAEGNLVAGAAARTDWPDLPLVAGQGVEQAVPEALALIAAAAPLAGRLRGLMRVGERRWDVILDRGQRIQLPEKNAVAALERLIALDQARDMLDREITVVDFRNPLRPTVRLTSYGVEEIQKIRDFEFGR
ncbi:cell division protein FtsQ/DivIB [Tropicimonas sp. IMCC34043]|uniref:cell division protein FtsQ/DivIB n=1 Tax=Tropicimonas sp. IMCC34043 TaxID=2248760 RepID=UPI001E2C4AFE|nr:cell division protein FtsQ/DivIB [Tropicimonas sp. IMCC34043]